MITLTLKQTSELQTLLNRTYSADDEPLTPEQMARDMNAFTRKHCPYIAFQVEYNDQDEPFYIGQSAVELGTRIFNVPCSEISSQKIEEMVNTFYRTNDQLMQIYQAQKMEMNMLMDSVLFGEHPTDFKAVHKRHQVLCSLNFNIALTIGAEPRLPGKRHSNTFFMQTSTSTH